MTVNGWIISKTDLSYDEIVELGLNGPWFVESEEGEVREFQTEKEAHEFALSQ